MYNTCFKTPWYFTMVSLFRNTMVFYHGFPVSKHHGILPWFPCFETPWYFTMVYLHRHTHTHTHTHTYTRTHADTHACTHNYTTHTFTQERTQARTHARTHFLPMHVVKANSRSRLFVSSRFTPAATIVVCLSYWKDKRRNDAV